MNPGSPKAKHLHQCAKRHQSSCLYIGGKWLLFLCIIGSSSVDVPVHPRTSEVGGVQEHTTDEKCGLVLEYRNAHEQLKYLALLVVGCWLLVPTVRAAFVYV